MVFLALKDGADATDTPEGSAYRASVQSWEKDFQHFFTGAGIQSNPKELFTYPKFSSATILRIPATQVDWIRTAFRETYSDSDEHEHYLNNPRWYFVDMHVDADKTALLETKNPKLYLLAMYATMTLIETKHIGDLQNRGATDYEVMNAMETILRGKEEVRLRL